MAYPTTFSPELVPLSEVALDARGQAAIRELGSRTLTMYTGVRRVDVSAIAAIGAQEAVREFCPNDAKKRFGDEDMMEQWLTKSDGRGMFLLKTDGQELAGYGWTGKELCHQLPDCTTTFAIRLNKEVIRDQKGLGAPFTAAIVSGSMALYGASRIGLETWGSNTAAVRSYLKAGAELVTTQDDVRPTLQAGRGTWEEDGRLLRRDIRQFMRFPFTF